MLAEARCPQHGQAAVATCHRCGRFVCLECARSDGRTLCAECFARPETRLASSGRSRGSLWLALAGFHGVLPLLPVALWMAQRELRAIDDGHAGGGGRAYAEGARWLVGAGTVLWGVWAYFWLNPPPV